MRAALLASRILVSQPSLNARHYEALIQMTKQSGATPAAAEATSRALVNSFCEAGQRERAMSYLREARQCGVGAFEPLLVACVREGDDDALRAAAKLMREAGAAPSGSTYGALLRERLKRGETTRALRVCDGALAAGVAPPALDVQALVVALTEEGLSGSALELVAAMRERHGRLLPLNRSDRATHALLNGAASSHAMPLEPLAVHAELKHHLVDEASAGRLSDELVLRCVRAGNLRAARALLRQLESEGVLLGPDTLDTTLQALLETSETQDALKLWDDQAARHVEAGRPLPWPSLRWATAAAPSPSHDSPQPHPPLPLDEACFEPLGVPGRLDLSALPEGAARIGVIRFFQRLAATAAATADEAQPSVPAEVVLLAQPSHADALVRTAASLVPPLQLDSRGRTPSSPSGGGEAGERTVMLIVEEATLARWAAHVLEQRSRAQRTNQFAAVAAGHNALWTLALVGGWIL